MDSIFLSRKSYTLSKDWQLPDLYTTKRSSDLKLFLPQGNYVLDAYRKIEFHGSFPVITAEKPRRAYRERLEQVKLAPKVQANNLEELPQVLDEHGSLKQAKHGAKLLSGSLQQVGSRYLNYMLMSGVDEDGRPSRLELWNLPLLLPDSTVPFQYLGQLEISLAHGPNEQTSLTFRVNNHLVYWKPYLDDRLSGTYAQRIRQAKRAKQADFVANLLQVTNKRKRFYARMEFGSRLGVVLVS